MVEALHAIAQRRSPRGIRCGAPIVLRSPNRSCYEIEEIVTQVPGTLPACVAATSVYDAADATEVLLLFFVPHPEVVSEEDVLAAHELGIASPALAKLCADVARRSEGRGLDDAARGPGSSSP